MKQPISFSSHEGACSMCVCQLSTFLLFFFLTVSLLSLSHPPPILPCYSFFFFSFDNCENCIRWNKLMLNVENCLKTSVPLQKKRMNRGKKNGKKGCLLVDSFVTTKDSLHLHYPMLVLQVSSLHSS